MVEEMLKYDSEQVKNGVLAVYISNNNLEGYTSQFLARLLERERAIRAGLEIEEESYFNLEYEEIDDHITFELQQQVLKDVYYKHIRIYFTDLSLDTDLCQAVEDLVVGLREKGHEVSLYLYDIDNYGQESAKKYDWYYLDTTRSTTKTIYNLLMDETGGMGSKYDYNNLSNLVDIVDAYVRFKVTDTINYEAGEALERLIDDVRRVLTVVTKQFTLHIFYRVIYQQLLGRSFDGEEAFFKHTNLYSEYLDIFKEKVNQKDKIGLENLSNPLTRFALHMSASKEVDSIIDTAKEYLTPEKMNDMTIKEIEEKATAYMLLNHPDSPAEIVSLVVPAAKYNSRVLSYLIFDATGIVISGLGKEFLLSDYNLDFIIGYEKRENGIVCLLVSLSQDDLHRLGRTNPMFDVSVLAKAVGTKGVAGHEGLSFFVVKDTSEIKSKVNEALQKLYKD